MKFHWKVLLWMGAGIALGLIVQLSFDAPAWTGVRFADHPAGVIVTKASGPAKKAKIKKGTVIVGVVRDRGSEKEHVEPLPNVEAVDALIAGRANGDVLWLQSQSGTVIAAPVGMSPDSPRAKVVAPFSFAADIFLALLKMLIVPLVFISIMHGVSGLGGAGDLRRLGLKAFAYYTASSLVAIIVGQILVNITRPGIGADLGLPPMGAAGIAPEASFIDVLKRMVPSNIFDALTSNGAMLQIIFFALLFGYCLTQTPAPHGPRIRDVVESLLEVVMVLATKVLRLIPYGVFALLVKIVATTGFAIFKPLALYMITVVLALVVHAGVTLPLVLKFVAGVSPLRWFQAMSPALITAFSTSSSSMTLPVTMETVERRGHVSSKITSFTLPLGATINMDGTALYECIGVIFLAQYYASAGGFELTLSSQVLVVFMALLASIGAAGIPSAGLVMMLTILSALGLPLEGAALLLAVDRLLDMMRTTVNVWSDTCAAAVIARTEGEDGPLQAGAPA